MDALKLRIKSQKSFIEMLKDEFLCADKPNKEKVMLRLIDEQNHLDELEDLLLKY